MHFAEFNINLSSIGSFKLVKVPKDEHSEKRPQHSQRKHRDCIKKAPVEQVDTSSHEEILENAEPHVRKCVVLERVLENLQVGLGDVVEDLGGVLGVVLFDSFRVLSRQDFANHVTRICE